MRYCFTRDDTVLIDAIVAFMRAGYEEPATIIVIVTEPHRTQHHACFQTLDQVETGAAIMYVDAVDLLSSFMVSGHPDQTRFVSAITPFLRDGPCLEVRSAFCSEC